MRLNLNPNHPMSLTYPNYRAVAYGVFVAERLFALVVRSFQFENIALTATGLVLVPNALESAPIYLRLVLLERS